MNTQLRSRALDPQDLRHVLRAETADLHARVDGCFPDGLGSPLAYGRYLVGMHRFAADFETVIGAVPRASYWLACDLHDLALAPLPPTGVRGFAVEPDERLGWEYVMAGSSVGARHLVRGVQALGHHEHAGARFLSRHAGGDTWRNVLDRLTARSTHVELPRAHLVQGARDAFLLVQSCFQRSFDALPAPRKEPVA